jgi:multidrug efflux pump subunit AcrB
VFARLLARKYSLFIGFTLYVAIGLFCWRQIPLELSPDAKLPVLTVSVSWSRTSPEVMEQEVTRRIEQRVYALRNVEKVSSVTSEGRSQVIITFQKQTNIDFRQVELRDIVADALSALPFPLAPPVYTRNVPDELESLQRFMVLSLSSADTPEDLLRTARQFIQLPLLGIDGLSGITIDGIPENALLLTFDTELLDRLGLRAGTVMAQLNEVMVPKPAGVFQQGSGQFMLIQTPGDSLIQRLLHSAIPVPGSGRYVQLREVATASIAPASVKQIRRINGKRTLTIQLQKEPGADALALADLVDERLTGIRKRLPPAFIMLKEYDATKQIRAQLEELSLQAWYALGMVFLVLLVFMRSLRAPFVIISTILLSLAGTVTGLYIFNYTLNIITQAALTISFGLLVDNAVVIYDHLHNKQFDKSATGTALLVRTLPEVFLPVFGATLTSVVIFLPLMFALPELRIFLEPIAVTISLALGMSLLCGFVWIPYSMIYLIRPANNHAPESFPKQTPKKRHVLRLLGGLRRWRWIVRLVFAGVIGLPLHLIPEPPVVADSTEKFQEDSSLVLKTHAWYERHRGTIEPWTGGLWRKFQKEIRFSDPWKWGGDEKMVVYIETPAGSPLEELDKVVAHFEAIAHPFSEHLEYFESEISEFYGARLVFHVKPEAIYSAPPYILKGELMYLAARTGNANISVSGLGDGFSNYGSGGGGTVTLELKGYSYDELNELSSQLKRFLLKNPRVSDVKTNIASWFDADNLYQLVLVPNEQHLVLNRLSRPLLFDRLQTELNPEYRWGYVEADGQKLSLLARAERPSKRLEDFRKKTLIVDSLSLPVTSLASLSKEPVLSTIRRDNQQYTRYIQFEYRGSQRFARQFAEEVVASFAVPVGVKLQIPQMRFLFSETTKSNTGFILILCFVCVSLAVAGTLNAVRNSIWVLTAIPLGAIGVMAGALYLDMFFGRGAVAGVLLLMGIIVNNSILLVYRYQHYLHMGIAGIRAWYYTLRDRTLAMAITTVTTIAGLAPVLWMSTDEFWVQLSITVAWGLGFGTMLLLILLPTMKGRPLALR